jgi:hypothetical protein
MNRSEFAQCLRDSIVLALKQFRENHPAERPYAFTIVGGQVNWIGYAIATEEGLNQEAKRCFEKGYRYHGCNGEIADDLERLSIWLRWENPDAGWHYGDFENSGTLHNALATLFRHDELADEDDSFEAFCADEVLAVLTSEARWSGDADNRSIIVGFTYGSDPRDFLRTATRANPYPVVEQLWAENLHSDEIDHRIKRSDRS